MREDLWTPVHRSVSGLWPTSGLPQTGREATRRNAILVDDMAGTVQRWDGRVDLRCTARFVSLTGHRVAVLVSGSILGWR